MECNNKHLQYQRFVHTLDQLAAVIRILLAPPVSVVKANATKHRNLIPPVLVIALRRTCDNIICETTTQSKTQYNNNNIANLPFLFCLIICYYYCIVDVLLI
jgi:hypothetical protein